MRAPSPALLLPLAFLGCLPRPGPVREIRQYDFGPAGGGTSAALATRLPVAVLVRPPEAPLWMDSPAINYRLAYDEPSRIRSYAYSRWVSSPMRLLGDLLRQRIAEANGAGGSADEESPAGYILQLQVEEFSQVFESRRESHALVRARAALLDHSGRQLTAQRAFSVEEASPTADAAGAVAGLSRASHRLADQIVAWLASAASTPRPPASG